MLVFLRLRHCNLTTVSGLNTLPILQTLDLSHNQLTSVSITDLSKLSSLHSLWLDENKLIQYLHFANDFSFPRVSQGRIKIVTELSGGCRKSGTLGMGDIFSNPSN
jgi:Leucine-rich repeat (LRR) protein